MPAASHGIPTDRKYLEPLPTMVKGFNVKPIDRLHSGQFKAFMKPVLGRPGVKKASGISDITKKQPIVKSYSSEGLRCALTLPNIFLLTTMPK